MPQLRSFDNNTALVNSKCEKCDYPMQVHYKNSKTQVNQLVCKKCKKKLRKKTGSES